MLVFLVATLYYVCFAFLTGFALFIGLSPQARRRHQTVDASLLKRQRVVFILLLFCLLLWQSTLFMESQATLPWVQLCLARINFAAVAAAVFLLWRFVELVALTAGIPEVRLAAQWERSLLLETILIIAITLLTPSVVETETVIDGMPTTGFGILFSVYLLHSLAYLAATVALSIKAHQSITNPSVRRQLAIIGWGIVATSGISLITNVVLPFWLKDFRFCDVGTLSTLLFVTAVAYAVFMHGLFNLRFVLSRALVGGLLLTFVLGGYSSGIFLITQYFSEGDSGASNPSRNTAQFVVLFLAFSFDPLRRLLEDMTDEMLFGKKKNRKNKRNRFRRRNN